MGKRTNGREINCLHILVVEQRENVTLVAVG